MDGLVRLQRGLGSWSELGRNVRREHDDHGGMLVVRDMDGAEHDQGGPRESCRYDEPARGRFAGA